MKFHPATALRFRLLLLTAAVAASLAYAEEVRPEAPFPMPAIQLPSFPERDFRITDYGAVEGGEADNTLALRQAITACHDAGGGRVVVPPGTWLTGAIHLRSNVNLHLAEGAVLLFSDDPKDYLPAVQSFWEGFECYNYSPLIYAFGCENVALSGKGTLRPRMGTWTRWFARPPAHLEALKQLYNLAARGVPVEQRQMAVGENNMRPDFVQFNRCRRVLVEDIRLRESPFWCLHLALCEGAVVRRVDFSAHGHNNDGVDIALSRNVLVEDCSLDQGDDAIVVKSGSNQDGWRLAIPSENIVIRRCRVLGGHQLLAVGSDISAGVRNVYLHDCSCQDAKEVERLVQHILFIKTNRRRGGFVENIWVENVTAPRTRFGVLGIETDVMYQWRDLVPTYEERLTQIRGIHLRNVRVGETWIPIRILGDARLPVRDVYIEDLVVGKSSGPPRQIENAEGIHENNVRIIKSLADTPGGS